MRKILLVMFLTAVLGFSTLANAALIDNGGGLIYDTDLDITWYDAWILYSRRDYVQTLVDNLSVTDISGNNITGWRLPSQVDGPYVIGYDGTTTGGWNITSSELGHLFYTELGNKGYWDVTGSHSQPDMGLKNMGPFTALIGANYWSATVYSEDPALGWTFGFGNGCQNVINWGDHPGGGLAVHDGNVGAPVPEPGTMFLLGIGIMGTAGIRRKIRG